MKQLKAWLAAKLDDLAMTVAYALPRQVAYWAFTRVAAHASMVHADRHIGTLTPVECMKAWKEQP